MPKLSSNKTALFLASIVALGGCGGNGKQAEQKPAPNVIGQHGYIIRDEADLVAANLFVTDNGYFINCDGTQMYNKAADRVDPTLLKTAKKAITQGHAIEGTLTGTPDRPVVKIAKDGFNYDCSFQNPYILDFRY